MQMLLAVVAVAAGTLSCAAVLLFIRPINGAILLLLSLIGGLGVGGAYCFIGDPAAALAARHLPKANDLSGQLRYLLAFQPTNADRWLELARAERRAGRGSEQMDAYGKAVSLRPGDAALLVEAAEARASVDEGRYFDDVSLGWLQQAQAIKPGTPRAGWLLGIALMQRERRADAVEVWRTLLPQLPEKEAGIVARQIALAGETTDGTAKTISIPVELGLSPALRQALPPESVVFILVRAPGGKGMPLAVKRFTLGSLPPNFRLDADDSPMPTGSFGLLKEVEIVAKISTSGDASRIDHTSETVHASLPTQGVSLNFP